MFKHPNVDFGCVVIGRRLTSFLSAGHTDVVLMQGTVTPSLEGVSCVHQGLSEDLYLAINRQENNAWPVFLLLMPKCNSLIAGSTSKSQATGQPRSALPLASPRPPDPDRLIHLTHKASALGGSHRHQDSRPIA